MKTPHTESVRRTILIAAALTGMTFVTGCFNPFDPIVAPQRGVYIAPPEANGPEGVIRLFEWCWENRAIEQYREIFTDDFQFQFAETDAAGNAFTGHFITRDDELDIAKHLFVGGGASPPANRITLNLGQSLIPTADIRPGKNPTYHKLITTNVVLYISTDAEDFNVTGTVRFFVVRGDSAKIPVDLKSRGFGPDPGRWYIDRWEDETLGSSGGGTSVVIDPKSLRRAATIGPEKLHSTGGTAAASGPLSVTWGFVKAIYFPQR